MLSAQEIVSFIHPVQSPSYELIFFIFLFMHAI